MFCFLVTGDAFQRQAAEVQNMTPPAKKRDHPNLLVAAPLFAL